MRAAEEQLKNTVAEYEARMHHIQQEMYNMEGERDTQNSALRRRFIRILFIPIR